MNVSCLGGAPCMAIVTHVHAIHRLSDVDDDTLCNVFHTHIA